MPKNKKTSGKKRVTGKMKHCQWAGVPEGGTNDSWDLFLACGGVLNNAISNPLLNKTQSYWFRTLKDFIDIKTESTEADSEKQSDSDSAATGHIYGLENIAPLYFRRSRNSPDVKINLEDIMAASRSAVKILTSNLGENFPFVVHSGRITPPPLAVIITAMLCAAYVLDGNLAPLDKIREVLTIFEEPPHKWELIGKSFTSYCHRKESWIKITLGEDDFSELDGSCCLSKLAFRKLLNIEKSAKEDRPKWSRSSHFRSRPRLRNNARRHLSSLLDEERKKEDDPVYCELSRPDIGLKDLVLPDDTMMDLRLVAQICSKDRDSSPTLLFSGPPGTGKTHAAAALSGEIKRCLATANLSQISDRFVGQTEKHLQEVFKEAERSRAVLLLDEADSLLYTRIDSHRSWEVTQVNTILKLLEKPSIPVILCTNFIDKLDAAVHRRILYELSFQVPGFEERRAIWKRELKLAGIRKRLNLDALSKVIMTGGLISNVTRKMQSYRELFGRTDKISTAKLLKMAEKEAVKMAGTEYGMKKPIGFSVAP